MATRTQGSRAHQKNTPLIIITEESHPHTFSFWHVYPSGALGMKGPR